MIENCSGFFLIDTFRDDVNSPEKRFLCLFHSRQTSHAPSFARGLDPNITSLAFIERQVEREKKKKKCVKGFSLYCTRIGVFESSKGRPSSATYARALPPTFFFYSRCRRRGGTRRKDSRLSKSNYAVALVIPVSLFHSVWFAFYSFLWRKPKS
jgi:hypothetical protein